jgi:hypothetical protein
MYTTTDFIFSDELSIAPALATDSLLEVLAMDSSSQ